MFPKSPKGISVKSYTIEESADNQFPNWDLCPSIVTYFDDIDKKFYNEEPTKSRTEKVFLDCHIFI